MSLTLLFWILMLIWVIVFGINHWSPAPWSGFGGGVLLFCIILTLGWKVFGSPIQ